MRALQRFGSGHKSNGVCPFLFFMYNSAPFATRKQAMDAELFLSPKMKKYENIIELMEKFSEVHRLIFFTNVKAQYIYFFFT